MGTSLRVVIDARMVGPIPHGISRYVTSLAKGLELRKKENGDLLYEPIFLVNPEFTLDHLGSFHVYPIRSPFLNPKEIYDIPRALKNLKADLYHSPSFSSLWRSPCPSIITIHDLNHLTYGSPSKKIYYETLLRRFSKRCAVILTVSEFSRREIAKWLDISPKKIQVIYNSIESPKDILQEDEEYTLSKFKLRPHQYFFCLSNSKSHKNLKTLINAYSIFHKQLAHAWPLVMSVGGHYPNPGVRTVGHLSSIEVGVLLKNSAGFFFPSLYEGFGLPPVEAAAQGIPLAISDIPPHREGLMDLAPHEVVWVKPLDLHGWVNAFHKISRQEISAPSRMSQEKILKRYQVEKMGESIDLVYQRVLGIKK